MERAFFHEIIYDCDSDASIDEIAASLVANARAAREAVALIESCHPDLEFSNVKVHLNSITQGSPLKELLTVSLVIGFQEDLEKEVPDFIKAMIGAEVPEQYDTIVTVFAIGIVLYGALLLAERVIKRRPAPLENTYRSVTHVAGDLVQVDPEVIAERTERRLGGKRRRSTIKTAKEFFRPAKTRRASAIRTSSTVTIPQDAIDAIPSDIEELDADTPRDSYGLKNVRVELRAHDLDREVSVWGSRPGDLPPSTGPS